MSTQFPMDLALAVLRGERPEGTHRAITPEAVVWLLEAAEIAPVDRERVVDALILSITRSNGMTGTPKVDGMVQILRKICTVCPMALRKLTEARDSFDPDDNSDPEEEGRRASGWALHRAFTAVLKKVSE